MSYPGLKQTQIKQHLFFLPPLDIQSSAEQTLQPKSRYNDNSNPSRP